MSDNNRTIQSALNEFFTQNNLGAEGGLNNDWAYLDMKWFRIPFPNTEARKKALVYHDVHHLATGYQSTWQGEAEVGAWEISTGCGPYNAALFLDSGAMAVGLIFYPVKTFRAFIRGQRTRNLYLNTYTREQLMPMRIAEVQQLLGLNHTDTTPAKVNEVIKFIGWSLVAALWYIPVLVVLLLLGAWYMGYV
jgi:hypothetical protein